MKSIVYDDYPSNSLGLTYAGYSLSIEVVERTLIEIRDLETYSNPFKTVRFGHFSDLFHFRLRFARSLRLSEKECTIPFDEEAPNWISEIDCKTTRDWTLLVFPSPKYQTAFECCAIRTLPGVEVWTGNCDAEPLR
jgi:hypothetical protein